MPRRNSPSILHGVGFLVGAGIPKGTRVNTFIECGCCGRYHRTDFWGDCRENSERYVDIPEGGIEVWEGDEHAPE